MEITYQPIGIIHSPFNDPAEMPIQPTSHTSSTGVVELYPEYVAGLQDLAGFSHLYLLYHFHQVRRSNLRVTPFLDTETRGLFATRAPSRPNPIGLSVVALVRIEDNLLHVTHLDVLNHTPLLDIKPYVPAFEQPGAVRTGWLERVQGQVHTRTSDNRFK